ncbi:peptidoglycan-binding domain-containing protein [Aureimonas sp. AU12]|uniref:peptidoglycan-binding domain-containing protein n=1 Tax=Aureimonas sp. AU12 TaxID=1638161 RepID=UPI0007837182|nr:peptidoglycan-binding domain-containing protein [Aureimonas sp. AU12]
MSMATTVLLSASPVVAQTFGDYAAGVLQEMVKAQSSERRAPAAKPRSDTLWLVIASREDPQEAVALGEAYGPTLGPTLVIQSRNGRYAVAAGTLARDKAKANLKALKELRLIPEDSFLSGGENLDRVVWHSLDGPSALDLMARPAYRQSVRRLQAAFSRLGVYEGPVDGLIGPSTGKAFERFAEQFGAPSFEVFDADALAAVEATAQDGFRNDAERSLAAARGFQDAAAFTEAQSGGFPSASAFSEARALGFRTMRDFDQARSGGFRSSDDYIRAKAGGFASAASLDAASRAGFETAEDYKAFQASGFSDAEAFRTARRAGFADRAAFEKAEADRLKRAQREARTLISDADAFLRLNPQTPGLLAIASEVATVNGAMGSGAPDTLAAATLRLRGALAPAPGFAAFEEARRTERVAEEVRRVAALRAELTERQRDLSNWVAANLTSDALPEIVAELTLLESDLKGGDGEILTQARERLASLIARRGLAAPIALLAARAAPSTPAPPAGGVGAAVAVTPANAPLLEGAPDDVVVLYNAGPRAPSLTRNLMGAFAFTTGKASLCTLAVPAQPALHRALAGELARFGASRIDLSPNACGPLDIAARDLLLVRRGDFLTSPPSLAAPVLEALEAGALRVFTEMPYAVLLRREAAETTLAAAIEADLGTGARNGFGALVPAKGGGALCAVVPDEREAHDAMLEPLGRFVANETGAVPPVRFVSADEAFQAVRQEDCRLVYASADVLKTMSEALKRDGLAASFAPFWYERTTLDAAIAERETARKAELAAAEARRLQATTEREDAERLARNEASTLGAKEAELRQRYGVEAAALLNTYSEALKALVLDHPPVILAGRDGAQSVIGDLFPAFRRWQTTLAPEDWQPIAVKVDIADYGLAQWRERQMEAIALETKVQIVSRERGEYREACFLMAMIVDGEFQMHRDPLETPCGDEGKAKLAAWSLGHHLESRWVAAR